MMKFGKEDVIPQNENVLVEVQKIEEVVNGIYVGNQLGVDEDAMPIEFFIGKIIKFGNKAKDANQCPELEVGKYAYFNQFGGYTIPTKDSYSKILPGYNIVAISNDMNMDVNTITPTNDRLLVEMIKEEDTVEGVYIGKSGDPRELNISLGKVISCGLNADKYKKGDIIAVDPYCGNPIIKDTVKEIRTINSADVLFTI